MSKILLNVLTRAVLIATHMSVVDCCSCSAPDPYYEVCDSDFAIQAKLVSVTYPNGIPEDPNEIYDIRYQLDIQKVFNLREDFGLVSENILLQTYGPSHLCGLELSNGNTYILTGQVINDTLHPDQQALYMDLCNYHILVGGRWGRPRAEVDELMGLINCSNPIPYYKKLYGSIFERLMEKRNQAEHFEGHENRAAAPVKKTTRQNGNVDLLMSRLSRRELANYITSFLPTASKNSRRRTVR